MDIEKPWPANTAYTPEGDRITRAIRKSDMIPCTYRMNFKACFYGWYGAEEYSKKTIQV
jgi:hypothetical protein